MVDTTHYDVPVERVGAAALLRVLIGRKRDGACDRVGPGVDD